MNRILLFVLTDFAILIVASVSLRLLGLEPWLNQQGINFNSLLVFGALLAVSTGLLNRMDRREVEAVLGHELSHVANGNMVTLTLIQGVVNTFVFVASRLIGNLVDRIVCDARLAGRNSMIGALAALKRGHQGALPDHMAAFGIAGGVGQGLSRLFMSHPPLDERIAALRATPLA